MPVLSPTPPGGRGTGGGDGGAYPLPHAVGERWHAERDGEGVFGKPALVAEWIPDTTFSASLEGRPGMTRRVGVRAREAVSVADWATVPAWILGSAPSLRSGFARG